MAFDPISAGIDLISLAVNKIWPDKTEQEKAELGAAVTAVMGQLDINKAEATNPNWFVAGWRPFVGWVCGAALAYAAIIEPFARFISSVFFNYHGGFPVIDTTVTMQILVGMLGLGGLRTYEKSKGSEGNR